MHQKIILIGFGTVGQGLARILLEKSANLKTDHQYEPTIVAVSDAMKGAVYCPTGLDPGILLRLVEDGVTLDEYPDSGNCHTGWDAVTTIREAEADVVCELAYTNLDTGEPALTHCQTAFLTGKHVVTSNKGPATLAYRDMIALARKHDRMFGIEGTVMSGTPILNLARETLAGNRILAARGILNGTTNYILSEMEKGVTYQDALQKAQSLGYAEADPTGDVEGFDARAKVTILANVLLQQNLKLNQVQCEGISGLTLEDIALARQNNSRWKLIGNVSLTDNGIEAWVRPEMVPLTHPLAGIMGATNAITFTTDLLGNITVVGPGAGSTETGYSILIDLLTIHHSRRNFS